MGTPTRHSFDASKSYRSVLWIDDRDAQDFSLNEMQEILDLERERLGRRVFKNGGVPDGLDTRLLGGGQLLVADGNVWLFGRMEPVTGGTLSYDPAKVTGTDTVYARWLLDQITSSEDATLVSPFSGDVVEERLRVATTLAVASPDAFDERFEVWNGTVPANWTLATGGSAKGYPARFGETAVKLVHTSGTETRLEREIVITPNTVYTVHFWVRTEDGKADLAIGHGAFADLQRVSPSWNPQDFPFATSKVYARQTFTVTSDANSQAVQIRFVIPAGAPSTEILIDAVLVTTAPLGALELDRHYLPLLFWDRATGIVTRAVPRASNLKMADLIPPLSGEDIIDIEKNRGLLDENATTTFDEHGHYRVPPGLEVTRDLSNDAGGKIGLRVAPGRGYVRGYRVLLPVSARFQVDRATTAQARDDEQMAFAFGTNLYGLGKAFEPRKFPIKQITTVTTQVVQNIQITRSAGSTDTLTGATNVVDILGAYRGTANAEHIGVGASYPVTFTEANNVLKLQTTKWDGSGLDAVQTLTFTRGTYTLAEILEALQRGSGRAYRSGRVPSGIEFFNSSGQLGIRTLVQAATFDLKIETVGNGSTADTPLGLTAGTYSGTGTYYIKTTDFLKGAGDTIDWSPGGAEPSQGQSYNVILYKTVNLIANTDFKLGGFAAPETYLYKVSAWGPDGEGVASSGVTIVTPTAGINKVTWSRSPGATSYHVYRSNDAGVNYHFLRNIVDPGSGTEVTMRDDGSMTPDTGKTPVTSAPTTLSAGASAGATSISVGSTSAFPSSGTGFINGTDDFTYSGKTGTTFTGIPASGAGSIVAHDAGEPVALGPGVFGLAVVNDNPGYLNLRPLGSIDFSGTRGEPMSDLLVSTTLQVDYEYYLPRLDRIVVDKAAKILAVAGVPAEDPLPAAKSDDTMELAQVFVVAGTTGEPIIANLDENDRPTVRDLRMALARLEDLNYNSVNQTIINQVAGQDTGTKKGIFADGLANIDLIDAAFDRNGVATSCFVDPLYQTVTVPRSFTRFSVSSGTLTRNAGASTDVAITVARTLPSTEVTLIAQEQWSDTMPVNPFAVFTPPPSRILLTPNAARWTVTQETTLRGRWELWMHFMAGMNLMATPGDWPSWRQAVQTWQEALNEIRNRVFTTRVAMAPLRVRVEGEHFGFNEDNIKLFFGDTASAIETIDPGTAGTDAGSVKADASGRWGCNLVTPATSQSWPGLFIPATVTVDVLAKGPVSEARAPFFGMLQVPEPPVDVHVDPIAQTIVFPADKTIGAVGVWFSAKATDGQTVTMQIRNVVNGFPGPQVLASREIAPSEITLGQETKITLREWLHVPANTSLAICLLTASNEYQVQIATLGRVGQNPFAWITGNPYAPGVLFASSNNAAWSPDQASDLRFKVYGRSFSSSAILEYTSVTADFTTLWLGVDQNVPPGTSIRWEYELSGASSVKYPFEPFRPRDVGVDATSVIIRAHLATTNPDVAPQVMRHSTGICVCRNETAGKYISIQTPFTQDLVTGNVYAYGLLPSGSTVTAYLSNDDGLTWTNAGAATSTDLDGTWVRLAWAAPNFPVSSGKRLLRVRFDLTAADRVNIPKLARLGATLR